MATHKEGRFTPKVDSPGLFILLVIFLFISLSILLLGLKNWRNEKSTQKEQVELPKEQSPEDESLSEYFKEEFAEKEKVNIKTDEYLLGDPFREICNSTSGDGKPAITSNTVCLR